HSGDVGIKPAPAAAITSDSDESSITKCGWSTRTVLSEYRSERAADWALGSVRPGESVGAHRPAAGNLVVGLGRAGERETGDGDKRGDK
ncbi:hypothetical protein, partial [Nonomuraea fastidiosa]